MYGVKKKKAKLVFNEYGTYGTEGTVVANVIRRIEVLMIIVAVDCHIKLREVGGVGVPSCVGSHQKFG